MSKSTGTEEALEAAEELEAEAREAEKAENAEKAEAEAEAEADGSAEQGGEESGKTAEEAAPAEEPVSKIVLKTGGAAPEKGPKPSGQGLAAMLNGGIALAVTLVLLVASLAASAFLWRAYSSASDELSAQQQVRTRSAEFARAFLVYEHSDLDGWEKRLSALAAPDFRTAIGQSVKLQFPLIKSLEAGSEATIRDVFVNDFEGTVAKTVVVADTQVSSKEFLRTVTGMRLLVELTEVKGRWLISGMGMLGVDDEMMTDKQGNEVDPEKAEMPEVTPTTAP